MHAAAMEALPRLKLSIRPTSEEGMVGCAPNRPTEDPGLLLLLAHSLSRTFGDQSPTHNKKGATERRKRKDASHTRCGYRTLALLVSTENIQRDFLENVCETSTPSQAGTSSRCQMEHLPTSDSMLDVVVGKWRAAFDTLKREHFSQRNNWSGNSPRSHSLHKTTSCSSADRCRCLTSAKMGPAAEPNMYEVTASVKKQLRTDKTAQQKRKDGTPDHSSFVLIRKNKQLRTIIH